MPSCLGFFPDTFGALLTCLHNQHASLLTSASSAVLPHKSPRVANCTSCGHNSGRKIAPALKHRDRCPLVARFEQVAKLHGRHGTQKAGRGSPAVSVGKPELGAGGHGEGGVASVCF